MNTLYRGLKYEDDNIYYYLNQGINEQRKWLYEKIDIPSFEITSFAFDETNDPIPSISENLNLELRKYASVSGKRIFFQPNLMNRWDFVPSEVKERKTEVVIKSEYQEYDTIHYILPQGTHPEFIPKTIHLQSQFGEFEMQVKIDDSGITYIRQLKMNKGRYPASTYSELRDFYKKIRKADKQKIVLLNST